MAFLHPMTIFCLNRSLSMTSCQSSTLHAYFHPMHPTCSRFPSYYFSLYSQFIILFGVRSLLIQSTCPYHCRRISCIYSKISLPAYIISLYFSISNPLLFEEQCRTSKNSYKQVLIYLLVFCYWSKFQHHIMHYYGISLVINFLVL